MGRPVLPLTDCKRRATNPIHLSASVVGSAVCLDGALPLQMFPAASFIHGHAIHVQWMLDVPSTSKYVDAAQKINLDL